MKRSLLALLVLCSIPVLSIGTEMAPPKAPAKPAASKVDPALEAAHTKEDVRRHRIIAAAHEAAAKCQESGKDEDICDAELAKACAGIAYGKYCGMKHPD
jgi:hypothetical protein